MNGINAADSLAGATAQNSGVYRLYRILELRYRGDCEFRVQSMRTTQPTNFAVLYDLRGVWQSPRSCKLYAGYGVAQLVSRNPSPQAFAVRTRYQVKEIEMRHAGRLSHAYDLIYSISHNPPQYTPRYTLTLTTTYFQ